MNSESTKPKARLLYDSQKWGTRFFLLVASIGMFLFILLALALVLLRFQTLGDPSLHNYLQLKYKTFPNYLTQSDAWKPLAACLISAFGFIALETWIGRNIHRHLQGSRRRMIGVWLLSSILVATGCSFLMVFTGLSLDFEFDEHSFRLTAKDFYPLFAICLLPWFLAAVSSGAVSFLLLHLRLRPLEQEALMETASSQHPY
jgi:hypothetical protein